MLEGTTIHVAANVMPHTPFLAEPARGKRPAMSVIENEAPVGANPRLVSPYRGEEPRLGSTLWAVAMLSRIGTRDATCTCFARLEGWLALATTGFYEALQVAIG